MEKYKYIGTRLFQFIIDENLQTDVDQFHKISTTDALPDENILSFELACLRVLAVDFSVYAQKPEQMNDTLDLFYLLVNDVVNKSIPDGEEHLANRLKTYGEAIRTGKEALGLAIGFAFSDFCGMYGDPGVMGTAAALFAIYLKRVADLLNDTARDGIAAATVQQEKINLPDQITFQLQYAIDFHEQHQASVFIESNATYEEEVFADVLLFSSYAIRNLVNNPGKEFMEVLVDVLRQVEPRHVKEFSYYTADYGVELIKYPGNKGRKQFTGDLTFDTKRDKHRFNMNIKGFGLLGKGLPFYSPNSVIVLLQYMLRKYEDHPAVVEAFCVACQGIVHLYSQRQLKLINQNQMSLQVTMIPFG